MKDLLGRSLRDLRISVTDRCNFRCTYCMPKEIFGENYAFLPRSEILSFEEIERLARIFSELGVEKIRLTGGEPLLRKDLPTLITRLAAVPGIRDIAMTTNGSLLTPKRAHELREAGLTRVTVSLDALDDETFSALNDVAFPVEKVLAGIEAASEAGLYPVKINTVIKRGVNEHSILEMAEHFRGTGHTVRFIEFMDVGTTNGWQLQYVVTAAEILRTIGDVWPLRPVEPTRAGDVATRYAYEDGAGEIGIISSVSRPFCGGCTRARLSSDGKLYMCLFAADGFDVRELLRSDVSDAGILDAIRGVWKGRDDRYSEQRTEGTPKARIEMSRIGG